MIATSATLSCMPTVRKVGYAIQEAIRVAIPKRFEANNSTTREVQILQAFALELGIGLWSGNKRKMEIAESHPLPLVTMLRRAGRFRRTRSPPVGPLPEDNSQAIEKKWHDWIEYESWKRLAFHLMIHDTQMSMSFHVPPIIAYNEITLDLPSRSALWHAKTAQTWKEVHLKQTQMSLPHQLPSLLECTQDGQPLLDCYELVDVRLSACVVLHRIWALIWDYCQFSYMQKQQSPPAAYESTGKPLISSSWHSELVRLLQNIRITFSTTISGNTSSSMLSSSSTQTVIMLELLHLHLHVSFQDIQLFAGKEGDEEARRVYPYLRQWGKAREARQAVWHAGQVLRAARTCKENQLRDFYAIALYHAGLVLWAYGMLSRRQQASKIHEPFSSQQQQQQRRTTGSSSALHGSQQSLRGPNRQGLIALDCDETVETTRFIALGRGTPAICRLPQAATRRPSSPRSHGHGAFDDSHESNEGPEEQRPVPLDDPSAAMEVVIGTLLQNNRDSSTSGGRDGIVTGGATSSSGRIAYASNPNSGGNSARPSRPVGARNDGNVPPLVENLSQLMRDLGNAAGRVSEGQ